MPGDDPSLHVLEVGHPEVFCRNFGMRRAEPREAVHVLREQPSARGGRIQSGGAVMASP